MGPLGRVFRFPRRSRRQIATEVDDEIHFHLEARAEQLARLGLSTAEARRAAEARFGDLERTRRALRESTRRREGRMRRRERLEAIGHDLRFALRQLRRQPGFAVVAVLTLAAGIAANAVMFGVIDRLLLRPPPHVVAPERVSRLYLRQWDEDGGERTTANISYRRLLELRDGGRAVADVAGYLADEFLLGRGDDAERVRGAYATASLFPLLGVRPVLGRFFGEAEDRPPDGARVVVLGYGLWQRRFGGDPGVIGRTVHVQSNDYTVVGVAPPGFAALDLREVDVWQPATSIRGEFGLPAEWATQHNFSWIEPVARLKPGVSAEQAAAVFSVAWARSLAEQLDAQRAAAARPRVLVAPALEQRGPQRSASARVSLWLAGVAGVVLLVACANDANLLLARGLERRREIAVRLALGVGRRRLVGQLVLESVLLALAGAVVGLVLAQWGGSLLYAVLLPDVGVHGELYDARVLAFTAAAAVVAGLLAGLVPALQASRPDLAATLKAGAREGGGRRARLRGALLVTQAALSVVLLVGAGLFVRSLHNARTVDLGLDTDRLVYATIDWRGAAPEGAEARAALDAQLLARLRALPEVERATTSLSLAFQRNITLDLFTEARDSVPRAGDMYFNAVGTDFFATTGARILQGRALDARDAVGTSPVMVVSEAMARAIWPRGGAVGRCLRVDEDTMPCATIVGVAQNVVQSELTTDSTLQYWVPETQRPSRRGSNVFALLARVRGEPAAAVPAIRAALQAELPGDAYANVAPMSELVDPSVRSWQLGATMFVAFGALALVIAAVGLYGVIAYHVSQRTHEMGVRRALGAGAGQLARTVLGEGVRAVTLGIAIGALLTWAAARWVEPLLFGVSPRDPLTYAAVAVVLLAVALLAGLAPARRAVRVDPSEALRVE
ncbi:MAG TPA: ADOP family duplicated permease [Gemmatimonadaceae bacterium]|nr:ADOP family duplicated permease [Gemmatimonadaceae bacterium]